ncbi:MAG: hypothetical protein U0271_42730 [Polyangiaceae bacterium]
MDRVAPIVGVLLFSVVALGLRASAGAPSTHAARSSSASASASAHASASASGATTPRVRFVPMNADGTEARERLPISRLPPGSSADPDAVRFAVIARKGQLPSGPLTVKSFRTNTREDATPLGELEVPLKATATCPGALGALDGEVCALSEPVRLVAEVLDRDHPDAGAALLVELGGVLRASAPDAGSSSFVVTSEHGMHDVRARLFVVRTRPGGPAPIGVSDADAVSLATRELERATAIWSACGLRVAASPGDVRVVDPPPSYLLSVGCDAPSSASGGTLRVRVQGKEISVPIEAGVTPRGAARVLAAALEKAKLRVTVSDNRVTRASDLASTDLLVRDARGALVALEPPENGSVSTDATLDACIGSVVLEDGLSHFGDSTVAAGSLEERTLIKAFDDGDPATVDIFVVSSLGEGARIGESFIALERGAIRNVVIEDRSGFRSNASSFTLSHELGHVLLDQPGHPDDYGRDTPTSLMDSDALDATALGPRRLSRAECERALRQSVPLGLARAP